MVKETIYNYNLINLKQKEKKKEEEKNKFATNILVNLIML